MTVKIKNTFDSNLFWASKGRILLYRNLPNKANTAILLPEGRKYQSGSEPNTNEEHV